MPVADKIYNSVDFLLCCADFQLLNRRHKHVNIGNGRIWFSICTAALPCL